MTADELLRLYPRETLRWLRGRLGLSQEDFAAWVGVATTTIAAWEARRRGISPPYHPTLRALLMPYLATAEGEAFARALGGE